MAIITTYDTEADVLFVQFGEHRGTARTTVVRPGLHVEFDTEGRLVGLELLEASRNALADALQNLSDGTEWLSLTEAADVADLSPSTLRVQLHNGRISGEKRGRDWVIARHVLDTYLDEVEQRAAGQRTVRPSDPRPNSVGTAAGDVQRLPQRRTQPRNTVSGARYTMAKNEKSSPKAASLAGKVLSGAKKATSADAKKLAGSVLTQAANKGGKKGK